MTISVDILAYWNALQFLIFMTIIAFLVYRSKLKIGAADHAIMRLLSKNAESENRNTRSQGVVYSLPVPWWAKKVDGTMVDMNQAYERWHLLDKGLTRNDYIGSTDLQVWGPEIAALFRHNDLDVLRSGEMKVCVEQVVVGGRVVDVYVIKYPISVNGKVEMIGGMQIPVSDMKENPADTTKKQLSL